jgi:hypothetical protein
VSVWLGSSRRERRRVSKFHGSPHRVLIGLDLTTSLTDQGTGQPEELGCLAVSSHGTPPNLVVRETTLRYGSVEKRKHCDGLLERSGIWTPQVGLFYRASRLGFICNAENSFVLVR